VKRFRFPLDSLLRLRELNMEREDEKLAVLFAEKKRLEQELESLRSDRASAGAALARQHELASCDLRATASYIVGLNSRITILAEQVKHLSEDIRRQQQQCLEARRDHKIVEKLKERRLGEWSQEAARQQESLASEAFLAKHGRELNQQNVRNKS
jgi:flagellar FliJ protein